MKTRILSAAGALALTATMVTAIGLPPMPAAAIPVFDSSNYAQNLLTAARALAQIDNQIRSLQNEAQMLINQAKNLSRIDFPQLGQLQQQLYAIDRLMGEAQGIDYRIDDLDQQFRRHFPDSYQQLLRRDQRVAAARLRLETAMAAFRQTMGVQSRIVENVRDDAQVLEAIVGKSQGAEGALQAQQATNQLLALTAKQQFQIQNLMAAQFRSDAIAQARAGQIARDAREATKRFLGDGKAYTPK